jgi:hypothetical protein
VTTLIFATTAAPAQVVCRRQHTGLSHNIHRNIAEYKLVYEILAALKAEFPDCKITLSTWGPNLHELEDHDDPRGEDHEFIVDWSNK